MFTYKHKGRKPTRWQVDKDGRSGFVCKTGDDVRCKRWKLLEDGKETFHKSRRAAFHFFNTGEKFDPKPVYLTRGKSAGKRIK